MAIELDLEREGIETIKEESAKNIQGRRKEGRGFTLIGLAFE